MDLARTHLVAAGNARDAILYWVTDLFSFARCLAPASGQLCGRCDGCRACRRRPRPRAAGAGLGTEPAGDVEPERLARNHGPQACLQVRQTADTQRALPPGPGDVSDQTLQDFLAHGYTTQNALEVILGIGTYTMSTLANRLTGAPVDDQLAAFA